MLRKEERQKGSLRCCLLHNSNLPTLHVVFPPETAWDAALRGSLCSSRQGGYSGAAGSGAILGITTPDGARAAARAVPGSLPCLARWGEGVCVGSAAAPLPACLQAQQHLQTLPRLERAAPLAGSLCSCLSQAA